MRLLDLPNLYTLFCPRPIKLFQYGRHFGKREVPIVSWPFKQCDMTVHIYIYIRNIRDLIPRALPFEMRGRILSPNINTVYLEISQWAAGSM